MFQLKLLKFDQPLSVQEIEVAMEGESQWMTRAMIAKKLGCSKSPSLVKILWQAIHENRLVYTITKMPNGVDCFHYALPENVAETDEMTIHKGRCYFTDL